jgi:hypothetical protein
MTPLCHSTLPVIFGTTSQKVLCLKDHDDSKGCDYETYIFVKDEEVGYFTNLGKANIYSDRCKS